MRKVLLLTLLLCNASAVWADITLGNTWPIAETDLLTVLQQKAASQNIQNQFNQAIAQQMNRPTPVAGITRATATYSVLFDPSVTIAGQTIDPLSKAALPAPLIFYNGDDAAQVKVVQQVVKKLSKKAVLILVDGAIDSQENLFQQRVYFDQQGILSHRFHLTQVPAVITQQGQRLKIEVIAP